MRARIGGRWLLRIEDLDRPREVPGSAAEHRAHARGVWLRVGWRDRSTGDRTAHYAARARALRGRGLTFECSCSRRKLADEERYPGYLPRAPAIPAWRRPSRLRVEPGYVQFADRIQGTYRQDVAAAVGDVDSQAPRPVVCLPAGGGRRRCRPRRHPRGARRRSPGQHAASDLSAASCSALPTPAYAHVPVLVEPDGRKLAKSARSVRLDAREALPQLLASLRAAGTGTAAGARWRGRDRRGMGLGA